MLGRMCVLIAGRVWKRSIDPVFVGDSITEHWYLPEIANPTLAELLPGSIDAGVPGQTSWQMVNRISSVLAGYPSVVVIEAGTNDLVQIGVYNETHTPLHAPASISYIEDMANQAAGVDADQPAGAGAYRVAGAGPRVLIASVVETSMPQYNVSAADIARFNDALRQFCQTAGYTYVDYQHALQLPDGTQDPADFAADGIHPNDTGYGAMWPVLQAALQ